jgi:hypothetical protein
MGRLDHVQSSLKQCVQWKKGEREDFPFAGTGRFGNGSGAEF